MYMYFRSFTHFRPMLVAQLHAVILDKTLQHEVNHRQKNLCLDGDEKHNSYDNVLRE